MYLKFVHVLIVVAIVGFTAGFFFNVLVFETSFFEAVLVSGFLTSVHSLLIYLLLRHRSSRKSE